MSQNLEDHVNTCDHLVNPAIHTNYTDDEKSPDHNSNGTTATEAREDPKLPNHGVKVQLTLLYLNYVHQNTTIVQNVSKKRRANKTVEQ